MHGAKVRTKARLKTGTTVWLEIAPLEGPPLRVAALVWRIDADGLVFLFARSIDYGQKGLLLAAIFNRLLESWVIGWGVVRDPRAQKEFWLYPMRDLLGFAVWCASYLSKSAVWRDHRYRLIRGGRIVLREEGESS